MKKAWCILLVLFAACSSANKDEITVKISGKNEIRIHGLPAEALSKLAHDTSNAKWLSLLPVYRLPADDELKDYQPEQPGRYKIVNNNICFTPDTAFAKGQSYFVRYYRYAEGGSLWDIIRKKNKPGDHPHTDLPFKL
ncbi:hypothetical protein LJ707_11995 [Mucilaginibacter sp. UR6-1]|uniref:hypothetical protein n=1 Tax=Mucilaginibacter sp. UR6-1 TaxID=1435643 RepID=UPI001E3FB542|nr:hypothetical protein [Mucilaginibacter sp. UR6-1]MCC8409652.1 hypothetical protein [Mucilaginibacter sp. UR6-1]